MRNLKDVFHEDDASVGDSYGRAPLPAPREGYKHRFLSLPDS